MTTDSTFKLSTQIIEAGQQIQATANELREAELNTPQVVPPFVNPTPPLSPVVQGAGWLVEQAGNGLRNLGFDEAEPEFTITFEDGLHTFDGPKVPDNMLIDPPAEPSWLESIIASLPEPDPDFLNLPEIIEIEPEDPDYQVFNEAYQIKDLSISALFSDDGLTATGPTMPVFNRDESMKSLTPEEKFFVTPFAKAAEGFGGLVLGAFGLDVDASEPYIPEVGVDALA